MARKRHYLTRLRAKRTRPKTRAPTTGWRIDELAELSQISRRKLRYYLEHRLIVPTELRGTATRYQRRELLRALGVAQLRAETGSNLAEIKRKLDALGDRDLEAWLRTKPLPPSAAAALGLTSQQESQRGAGSNGHGDTTLGNGHGALGKNASTWQRVSLLPGLELMIAANASNAVLRAAQRICEEYVEVAEPRSGAPDTAPI